MKNKTILIVLALAALLLSACAPTVVSGAALPAPRVVTVTGAGLATLTPDIAYIYIGVHADANAAAEAVSQNSAKTETLIAAIQQAGVAAEDIRTTNFSIYSSPQYGPDGQPTGQTTYAVDNTVYVTVRDLAGLGKLLDQAVQAGANTVNNIQFDVADKTQAMSDARQAAVKAAKTQAEELAAAAGVTLGSLQTISSYDSVPAPVFDARGMGGGGVAAASAVPINPGTMQLTVTVTLTYEIK